MSLILSGTDGLSDVDGTVSTPAIRGTDSNTGIFFPAADTIAFSEGGAEAMRIDSSGNLGIGTASPVNKLQIGAASDTAVALSNSSSVTSGNRGTISMFNSGTSTVGYIRFGAVTDNVGTDIQFGIRPVGGSITEAMRIDSSGNVGIGTSSPVQKLQVNGAAGNPATSGSTQNGLTRLSNTTDNGVLDIGIKSGGTGAWLQSTDGGASGLANQYPLLLNPVGGNVGIGTSSPNAKFDVTGGAKATTGIMAYISSQSSGANSKIQYSDGFTYNWTAGATGNNFTVSSGEFGTTAGSERMRIDSSGNLLVGTTSLSFAERLSVKSAGTSSASDGVFICNSAGTALFRVRSDGAFQTGAAAVSPYNNTTGSAANTFVNTDGTLLRSTSSLKYKKDVKDATHGLTDLLKLRSVTYKGKNEADGEKTFGGLIAEEVDAAGLTEFVQYALDGSPDALNYGNMVSLCVKAIQELKAELDSVKAELQTLKGN